MLLGLSGFYFCCLLVVCLRWSLGVMIVVSVVGVGKRCNFGILKSVVMDLAEIERESQDLATSLTPSAARSFGERSKRRASVAGCLLA